VVFTVSTATGMRIAREALQGRVQVLHTMPFDGWWAVRRFIRRIRPEVFILVETDIWPGFLNYLHGLGVPSILVNGRISPRTHRAYRRTSWLVRRMFKPLKMCLMQSELDRRRLLEVGLAPQKVLTTGNIKFDRNVPLLDDKERHHWLRLLNLTASDPVWVAGSTHRGEEDMVLQAFERLRLAYPSLRLILAPRDISRTMELKSTIRSMKMQVVVRSKFPENRGEYDVLLLDTYGELDRIYGLGWVSFVGGSLVPVGGHNLLEPASLGSPVVFGPYTQNFVFMAAAIVEAGGGIQVADADTLYAAVKDLLDHPDQRAEMGDKGMAFVAQNRGAVKHVVSWVRKHITAGEVA
ncbi:MAG: 3-deoxy-D-manno-octulosonic acid transferase, partial [Deltaproteobacteria bacterium]|nr:3-deoxy-D-manno-octulosonic acid transferase [Deltaproteobacteria bacterium]